MSLLHHIIRMKPVTSFYLERFIECPCDVCEVKWRKEEMERRRRWKTVSLEEKEEMCKDQLLNLHEPPMSLMENLECIEITKQTAWNERRHIWFQFKRQGDKNFLANSKYCQFNLIEKLPAK